MFTLFVCPQIRVDSSDDWFACELACVLQLLLASPMTLPVGNWQEVARRSLLNNLPVALTLATAILSVPVPKQ